MRRSSWFPRPVSDNFASKPKCGKRLAASPPKRRRLAFEPLEDRSLLSVCLWNGGGAEHTNWNNIDNWVNDQQPPAHVVPQPGDELWFVGTAPGNGTQNDFPAGTSFKSIDFAASGFVLAGNALALTDDVTVASGVTGSTISLNVALAGALTVNVADTTLSISGNLSGSNYLAKTGAGTLCLGGANSYSGGTTINDGTLMVDNDAALVQCANGLLVTGQNAVLDLNGHDVAVGTVGLINGSIVNSSATPATLTGADYVVLNGTIDVPLGNNAAPLLKGTNGDATLAHDAWSPILNGGGADIQGGKLILDYTGGTSPASIVFDALDDGYDQTPKFASGPLINHARRAWVWLAPQSGAETYGRPRWGRDL